MRRSAVYTAAVEIDEATSIKTREDYTVVESVIASPIDEPDLKEELEGISQ